MKYTKKIKSLLIIVILILALFFMLVTNNVIKIKSNTISTVEHERFIRNIKFSKQSEKKAYIEFNGEKDETGTISVIEKGQKIVFETPIFTTVGDKAIIHYWITNENGENAKIGNLICKKSLIEKETSKPEAKDNDIVEEDTNTVKEQEEIEAKESTKEDYISIIPKNELKNTTIFGGKTSASDGTVEIELVKPYTGTEDKITYQITCTIEAKRDN